MADVRGGGGGGQRVALMEQGCMEWYRESDGKPYYDTPYIHIHICIHICILYLHIHKYIHICTHTHIHTYIHTYIHRYHCCEGPDLKRLIRFSRASQEGPTRYDFGLRGLGLSAHR